MIAILRNRLLLPLADRDSRVADEAEEKLRLLFDIMDGELQRTGFFAGNSWGLADFMVACVLYIVQVRLKMDLHAWGRLGPWLTASVERPAALVARKLREPS